MLSPSLFRDRSNCMCWARNPTAVAAQPYPLRQAVVHRLHLTNEGNHRIWRENPHKELSVAIAIRREAAVAGRSGHHTDQHSRRSTSLLTATSSHLSIRAQLWPSPHDCRPDAHTYRIWPRTVPHLQIWPSLRQKAMQESNRRIPIQSRTLGPHVATPPWLDPRKPDHAEDSLQEAPGKW